MHQCPQGAYVRWRTDKPPKSL